MFVSNFAEFNQQLYMGIYGIKLNLKKGLETSSRMWYFIQERNLMTLHDHDLEIYSTSYDLTLSSQAMTLPVCAVASKKRLKCWQELVQSFSALSSTAGEWPDDELSWKQLRADMAKVTSSGSSTGEGGRVYLGLDVSCVKWSKTFKWPQPDMLHWTCFWTALLFI